MGARYLKVEETVIRTRYSTAPKEEILKLIPDRTWLQIGVHARHMRILRTTNAWGSSVRDGRKALKHSWSDIDNERFDRLYPVLTRVALLVAFPPRSWKSIQSHAQKRGIHRTREAKGRQINIGRKKAKEEGEA